MKTGAKPVAFRSRVEVHAVRRCDSVSSTNKGRRQYFVLGGCLGDDHPGGTASSFDIRYEWHEKPLARGPGGKFEEFICRAE